MRGRSRWLHSTPKSQTGRKLPQLPRPLVGSHARFNALNVAQPDIVTGQPLDPIKHIPIRSEQIVDRCREAEEDLESQLADLKRSGKALAVVDQKRALESEDVEERPESAIGASAELGAPAYQFEDAQVDADRRVEVACWWQ